MISAEIDNAAFNAKMKGLLSRISGRDLRRIYKKVGIVAAQSMYGNFVYEGIKPNKWKENAQSTKNKKPAGRGVLDDTGALKMGISSEVRSDGVYVGADKEYGKFHLPPEKSGHPSKGIMPVRDWLGFDEDGLSGIENAVVEEIEDSLN